MKLNINGRMKVKTLINSFKSTFGLTLRVYDGRSFADPEATLASIRKGETKNGEISPKRNMKVGNLEDKILDIFGIKTQIAGSDNNYLCDNDHTLAKALEVDGEKILKKEIKKQKSEKNNTTEEKKYYKLTIENKGGEYGCGFVTDEEKKQFLFELADEQELGFSNYLDDKELSPTTCDHQLVNTYGPWVDGAKVSLSSYADEFCEEDENIIFWLKNIEDLDLNIINSLNPDPLSCYNIVDEEAIEFSGFKLDDNITFSFLIEIGINDKFELKNLYIDYINMDECISDDDVIDGVYYINSSVATKLIDLYPYDKESGDTLALYIATIKEEEWAEEQRDFLELLETTECKLMEGEGSGSGRIAIRVAIRDGHEVFNGSVIH